ncbi:MAG: hypothetical protein BGO05_17610 [Rhizobiales bacterium 63-7]|uniref:hypothetical protein n=1 Tax=Rhizobium sp. YJ-22 TaxID=3037556 RepID=UPI0009275680|nr:hypothetical protein [Rhizobium sp. YJ-22]MBN9030285.1 hypothetical protein [Hyphomicrobiales bacterium]MDG3579284.1 hypothetical protein [Rhizobium sp. YJ-22]OJU68744.1 MAG: hypothetical protein BGO05_17610 [Rhizobiales bacterium 63-7]
MISTDTWLKIIGAMMANAIVFGVGVVTVLMVPWLADHAKYSIPAVTVISFVTAPFLGAFVADRMRIRNWGREKWRRGDLISG